MITLLDALPLDKTVAESYESLLRAMVTRHEEVSLGKNRLRWCYLDSGFVVRDDLRPLGNGWHAMRFPQPDDDDVALKAEDVDDGPVDVPDETGRLTPEEKASVMIDLRPTPAQPSGR